MTFTSPTWLWAFSVVAAAAAWAMVRPGRRLIVVASLSLWQQALADTDRAARRMRHISASWVLLLAGAAAGVLALAKPVIRTQRPARQVAVGIRPSAELGGAAGTKAMREAVGVLLAKLSSADRVQLLLPAPLGGASGWLSARQARDRLAELPILAAPATDLDLPAADTAAQHTYIFTPAGADSQAGPDVTVISLPAGLPPLTLDAAAGAADPAGGVRVFAAVRNQTNRPGQAWVALSMRGAATRPEATKLTVPAGGRAGVSFSVPAADAICLTVAGEPDGPALDSGWLVRHRRARAKVAMVGPDEPLLRRFVRASEGLTLVGSEAQANLVIANAASAPEGKPALLIDPQGTGDSPPGWSRSRTGLTVVSPAVPDGADPVMRELSLRGLAIRHVRPWERGPQAAGKVLAQVDSQALIVRSDPAAEAVAAQPRRVWIAFDLSGENARFDRRQVLPMLLAQAVDWVLGEERPAVTYESTAPLAAAGVARWGLWKRSDGLPAEKSPLPGPGLYSDQDGQLHAVTLTGLAARPVAKAPQAALALVMLPAAVEAGGQVALWPWLCLAAMAMWLAGWGLRAY